MRDTFIAPLEVKFASEEAGEFEGYGAVFGNVDSHGDVILPGAFMASLAQHKARGGLPTMYAQHGPALGGDTLPVGVWTEMEEDSRGLRVKGRISALDTDYGRRIRSLVQDGALKGLSIGYRVASNGAVYGKKPGEPKRTLKSLHLVEVSLVDAASNSLARVESIKAATEGSVRTAIRWLRAAISLHERHMSGDAPTTGPDGERSQQEMMDQMERALAALTSGDDDKPDRARPSGGGHRMGGMKGLLSLREVEEALREQLGLSRSQAAAFAASGYKSLVARDERDGEAKQAEAKALAEIRGALSGFSLNLT